MIQNLAQYLDTLDGVKTLVGGGLFGGRAKKAFTVWSQAQPKGVSRAYVLAGYNFDDNPYEVKAFSVHGTIDQHTFAELSRQAHAVCQQHNLRAAGYLYNGADRWEDPVDWVRKNAAPFRALSRPHTGIYVFAHQLLGTELGTSNHVAWGFVGGVLHITALEDSRLN